MDEEAVRKYVGELRSLGVYDLREREAHLTSVAQQWKNVPRGAGQRATALRLLLSVQAELRTRGMVLRAV